MTHRLSNRADSDDILVTSASLFNYHNFSHSCAAVTRYPLP